MAYNTKYNPHHPVDWSVAYTAPYLYNKGTYIAGLYLLCVLVC